MNRKRVYFLIKIGFIVLLLGGYFFGSSVFTSIVKPFQDRGLLPDIDPSPLHIGIYTIVGYYFGWTALILAFLGEAVQHFWPGKVFDMKDIVFNYFGVIMGLLIRKMRGKEDLVKMPKIEFPIKISRTTFLYMFIFGSLILNFSALYIVRMAIHYVYLTHDIGESSAFITIVDKLSQLPFLAWFSIGVAVGIIVMSVLIWALDFGVKDKR